MANIYDKASLVMIPSGTKASKIFSQKPVNGDGDFTFSRSTAATRVNADGNIEKETQNLLTYSNTFDNAAWVGTNRGLTSGQSGYDGGSDAWLLTKTGAFGRIQQNLSYSGVVTISVYAKANASNYMRFYADGNGANIYFDLVNGNVSSGNDYIDANVEDIGSGWYRCSAAFAGGGTSFRIYPSDNADTSGTSGSIYIQDAQVEQGLVARDYIETTTAAVEGGITDNVPRLDYTDSSCPALLLEPQRTNLLTYSEYFSASGVWLPNTITITDNYGTSPEGLDNSTRLVLGNLTASRIAYAPTLTNGTTYTFSCYYKGTAGEKLYMEGNGSGGSGTQTSKLITLTGEWQREDLQFVGGSTSNLIYIVDSRNGSEDTAQDFEVFGAQLEQGSYPTSYIPTYGTSVTRNVDRNLLSTIPVDTSNNYTIFMDLVRISDNEHTTKWFDLRGNGGTYIQFYMISGGGRFRIFFKGDADASSQNMTDENNPQKDEQYKLALVRTDSSLKLFANGALIVTRTDKIPDELDYYAEWNENRINNHMLFPTALTDQEAIDLTTI